jgi:hypothetical protein
MTPITIKPTDFNGHQCYLFPSFVSNGHWLIAKSAIVNAVMFATEATAKAFLPKLAVRVMDTDDAARAILASTAPDAVKPLAVWTVRPWVSLHTSTGRKPVTTERALLTGVIVIGGRELAEPMFVDRQYVTRFGLMGASLVGAADVSGAIGLDTEFAVMPIRDTDTGGLLAPFRQLVRAEDRDDAEHLSKTA